MSCQKHGSQYSLHELPTRCDIILKLINNLNIFRMKYIRAIWYE